MSKIRAYTKTGGGGGGSTYSTPGGAPRLTTSFSSSGQDSSGGGGDSGPLRNEVLDRRAALKRLDDDPTFQKRANRLAWWLLAAGIILILSGIAHVIACLVEDVRVYDLLQSPIYINFYRTSGGRPHTPTCEALDTKFADVWLLWVAQFGVGAIMVAAGAFHTRWNKSLLARRQYYARYVYISIALGMTWWFTALAFGILDVFGWLFIALIGLFLVPILMYTMDYEMQTDKLRFSVDEGAVEQFDAASGGAVSSASMPAQYKQNGALFLIVAVWAVVLAFITTAYLVTTHEDVSAMLTHYHIHFAWLWITNVMLVVFYVLQVTFGARKRWLHDPVIAEFAFSITAFLLVIVQSWIAYGGGRREGNLTLTCGTDPTLCT